MKRRGVIIFFLKKKQEIFWRYKKNPYLCTRNQEMNATQV